MYSASIVDSATISHWRSKSKNWPERDRRKTNKQGPLRIMQSTSLAILAGSLMGFAAFHAWHMLCKLWSVIPAFLVRHPLAALWADEQRRIFNCCAWKSWIKYSTGAPLLGPSCCWSHICLCVLEHWPPFWENCALFVNEVTCPKCH